MYNWESSAKANHKKVKKTGTVVFHPDTSADTSLAHLLKDVAVRAIGPDSEGHDEPDAAQEKGDVLRTPLMTTETVAALEQRLHFSALLPCQAQCYQGIFNRRDVILHSRTGSGKTLAYALPIIERHLLVDRQRSAKGAAAASAREAEGPFMLIFVFSNDLAVQTKGVLARIYPNLRIGVADFDAVGVYDVLIGTVQKIDKWVRGRKAAAAATALEEKEKTAQQRLLAAHGAAARERQQKGVKRARDAGSDDDDAADEESDGEDDESSVAVGGVVSVANVRAVVIDEVDSTLGPRFSSVGRRMKNLLKYVRRANGSLAEGLLSDFRAHHYVLCGATIPNWVVKAGFLGVKKYYYRLVPVGAEKLPASLACYQLTCPMQERVSVATQLLTDPQERLRLGRVVVFGSHKQITGLEAALLQQQVASSAQNSPKASKKSKGKSGSSLPAIVARTLTAGKDELDRIAAMEDFNSKTASVLLCTDIAARGLDFVEVETVLMLMVPRGPMAAETFVHRAGRTARVDRQGQCLLLSDASENDTVDIIVKSAHVVFRKFQRTVAAPEARESEGSPAKKAAPASERCVFLLTVRNQFRLTRPDVKVPTAREVLKANLPAELKTAALQDAREVDGNSEVVQFSVPAEVAHEVQQSLWKYNLKECPRTH